MARHGRSTSFYRYLPRIAAEEGPPTGILTATETADTALITGQLGVIGTLATSEACRYRGTVGLCGMAGDAGGNGNSGHGSSYWQRGMAGDTGGDGDA